MEQVAGTKGGLWTYRRLIDASLLPPASGYPNDISMLNWPGNDYRDQSILDRSPLEQARALQDAKRVGVWMSPGKHGRVHRDHATGQIGRQAIVVVPVAGDERPPAARAPSPPAAFP